MVWQLAHLEEVLPHFLLVGFKQDQVVRLEKHLEDGHYMVVINGSEEHVSQAHVLLHTHDEHEELHK